MVGDHDRSGVPAGTLAATALLLLVSAFPGRGADRTAASTPIPPAHGRASSDMTQTISRSADPVGASPWWPEVRLGPRGSARQQPGLEDMEESVGKILPVIVVTATDRGQTAPGLAALEHAVGTTLSLTSDALVDAKTPSNVSAKSTIFGSSASRLVPIDLGDGIMTFAVRPGDDIGAAASNPGLGTAIFGGGANQGGLARPGTFPITAVVNNQVFTTGTDIRVYRRQVFTPTGEWGDWQWVPFNDGLPHSQYPRTATYATPLIDGFAFGTGQDGGIYQSFNLGPWTPFDSGLPIGPPCCQKAYTVTPFMNSHVFALAGRPGRLFARAGNANTGFGAWVLFEDGLPTGNQPLGNPDNTAIVATLVTPLVNGHLFAVASQNFNGTQHVYVRYRGPGGWSAWQWFGQGMSTSARTITPLVNGHMFSIGEDARVMVRWADARGWSNWTPFGEGLPGARSVTAFSGDHVFAIGGDDKVYARVATATGWTNWFPWGAGLPDGGKARYVSPLINNVVTAIGFDHAVYARRWVNLPGLAWTDWFKWDAGLPPVVGNISGNVVIDGVRVCADFGMNHCASSDANGNYVIPAVPVGYHYVVPHRPGESFFPPFQQVLLAPHATNVNFQLTSSAILGSVGVPNHRVTADGGPPDLEFGARSDAAGNYRITVGSGGSYVVKPDRKCGGFAPGQRSVAIPARGAHVRDQNFVPNGCSIRGNVEVPNAIVTARADGAPTRRGTSDAAGNYAIGDLEENTTYTVTVSDARCGGFAPQSRTVGIPDGGANRTGISFSALQCLSGVVRERGAGTIEVVATAGGAPTRQATVDAAGNFTIAGLVRNTTYEITPSGVCGLSSPRSRTRTVGTEDATGVDFLALRCITGNVGIAGVEVTARSPGHDTRSATSADNGDYVVTRLDQGATYTVEVAPASNGCTFEPTSRSRTTSSDRTDVNFATDCGDPSLAGFWRGGITGFRTRAGLLNRAADQACRNRYYPQYFCSGGSVSGSAVKSALRNEPLGALLSRPKSHPNPDAGCSTPLEQLPGVGIWAQGGAGIDNLWFRRACDNHDQCYQHGWDPQWEAEVWGGNGSKFACDDAWNNDMIRTCSTSFVPGEAVVCRALAAVFFGAVKLGGTSSYHVDKVTSQAGTPLNCSTELRNVETVGSVPNQVVHVVERTDVELDDSYCRPARIEFTLAGGTNVTNQYRQVRFSVPGGVPQIATSTGVFALCPRVGERCTGDLIVRFDVPVSELLIDDVVATEFTGQVGVIRAYRGGEAIGTGTFLGQVNLFDGQTANLGHLGRITRVEFASFQSTQIDSLQFKRDPFPK